MQIRVRAPPLRIIGIRNRMDLIAECIPASSESQTQVPEVTLVRLVELLELAARRGAFEIEEYQRIGGVYETVLSCLPPGALSGKR